MELQDYLRLPYTKTLRCDEDGDVVASVRELPGCVAHGENEQAALENLNAVQEAWIDEHLKVGDPVPLPEPEEPLPSGKWVQRVPRSLHKKLSEMAKREGVSLNQLVTSLLAEAVGERAVHAHAASATLETCAHWSGSVHGGWRVVQAEKASVARFARQLSRAIPDDVVLNFGESTYVTESKRHGVVRAVSQKH